MAGKPTTKQPKASKASASAENVPLGIRIGEVVALVSAAFAVGSAAIAFWQTSIAIEMLNDERHARAPDLNPEYATLTDVEIDDEVVYLLSVNWMNSGQTSTKDLSKSSGCGKTPAEARARERRVVGPFQVAANSTQIAGGCYLNRAVVGNMLEKQIPHFFTANVSYRDAYGERYERTMCYGILLLKRANFVYDEPSTLTLQTTPCETWQCKDGTCTAFTKPMPQREPAKR